MSIISKSKEDLIREAKSRVASLSDNALIILRQTVKGCFDDVWNNSEYTPQEFLNSCGTDASKLFIASAKTQQLIKALDPTYEYLISPKQVTINEDGTVTVLESEQE